MKKWSFKCLLLSLGLLFITSQEETKAAEATQLYGLKDSAPIEEIIKTLEKKSLEYNFIEEIQMLSVEGDTSNRALDKYDSFIEWSGPEQVIEVETKTAMVPQAIKEKTASLYDSWRWDIIRVTNNGASYGIEKGNHTVKVAVVDSGIDFNHPDLASNIVDPGKSFVPGITTTQDYLGHGTMVAGIIAANGNLQGIAPNVGLVPYKVFHTDVADSMWIIEAIVEAAKDDMDVINLSLGTYKSLKNKEDQAVIKAYQRAAKFAISEGSIIIASAGTDGYNMSNPKDLSEQLGEPNDVQIHLPGGGLSDVVTVSATNNLDQLAFYSNFGPQVNIAAPAGDYGEDYKTLGNIKLEAMTITTYPLNIPQSELSQYAGFEHGYEFMIGTSLAAPKVSAVAALIIAEYQEKYNKKPSVNQVKKYLYEGVSKVSAPRNEVGVGIVNAYGSLKAIKEGK
ncbi:S8 family serine peptidase [Lysinibacillus xylanilyticus]|uniref:S8 family serine peptidase n=1 Tax=Lysinibacillus xylanilyticus TaxID=582475 RepID=UPI003805417A